MDTHLQLMLTDWVASQTNFEDCLLPANIELHREARLEFLAEATDRIRVVTHQGGFVAWETDLSMEDTGATLARVWASSSGDAPQELWSRACTIEGSEFLMAIRKPNGAPAKEILENKGFELYRQRYTLTPRVHDLQVPRMAQFRLRLAGPLDRPTICNIASEQVSFTIPPEFQADVEKIVQYTHDRFNTIDYGDDSPTDIFLAEDDSYRTLGYILLHPGEPGTLYLDDMAVRREYWGKYVGHFMIRAVENLMIEHDFQTLYADISQANRRSHVGARRQIGFVPFLEYWLKKS